MHQEAADELACIERHHPVVSLGAIKAIVLPLEGDALVVGRDQAAVGDGDAVGVARKIAQDLLRSRKVKKLKRQRTRSLIHGPDSGSADRPAHSWGDQWRRHSGTTVGPRGPLWIGRASLPTLAGRWIKSCWRGTNIWPRKTAS